MIVVVPGKYMTKVTYGHRIRAAVIRKVSPVANKILALFGE